MKQRLCSVWGHIAMYWLKTWIAVMQWKFCGFAEFFFYCDVCAVSISTTQNGIASFEDNNDLLHVFAVDNDEGESKSDEKHLGKLTSVTLRIYAQAVAIIFTQVVRITWTIGSQTRRYMKMDFFLHKVNIFIRFFFKKGSASA